MFNLASSFSLRIHGYGGQGVKTLASVLAEASINHGLYAQAFPEFGPERRGAPVKAFVRFSSEPILSRASIEKPDFVIVLDLNVFRLEETKEGLTEETTFLLNSDEDPKTIKKTLGLKAEYHRINTLNIDSFLEGEKAVVHRSIPVLGRFIRITEAVPLEEVRDVLRKKFLSKIGEKKMSLTDRVLEESYHTL